MAFDENFLRRTYGAGISDAQNEQINALRMKSIESQERRADKATQLAEQQYTAEQQKINTQKLLAGVQQIKQNPQFLERIAADLVQAKILNPAALPGIMQQAQSDPAAFQQSLNNLESQLAYALGGSSGPSPQLQKSTPFRMQRPDGTEAVVTPVFNPQTGQTELKESPYSGEVISSLGETPQERQQREITTAGGKETAEGISKREQEMIDSGLRMADSTAVLRRGIQLLDLVGTGRPEEIALEAKNLFGIAGADETELNANLGKAILGQLRQTFGAQFTAEEGKQLKNIEANFGKSTEGNKRLLNQALKIAERAARRGISAAEKAGDDFTAQEIRNALEFDIDPEKEFEARWEAASSGEVLKAPDGTLRQKP